MAGRSAARAQCSAALSMTEDSDRVYLRMPSKEASKEEAVSDQQDARRTENSSVILRMLSKDASYERLAGEEQEVQGSPKRRAGRMVQAAVTGGTVAAFLLVGASLAGVWRPLLPAPRPDCHRLARLGSQLSCPQGMSWDWDREQCREPAGWSCCVARHPLTVDTCSFSLYICYDPVHTADPDLVCRRPVQHGGPAWGFSPSEKIYCQRGLVWVPKDQLCKPGI